MCVAQGPQRSDAGEAWIRGPSVSSQALYHCAPIKQTNKNTWASTYDFQHCAILTSVYSDETVQPAFKLRNSVWYFVSNTHRIFKRPAKSLIRLSVCAGWSESLLAAHTTLCQNESVWIYMYGSIKWQVLVTPWRFVLTRVRPYWFVWTRISTVANRSLSLMHLTWHASFLIKQCRYRIKPCRSVLNLINTYHSCHQMTPLLPYPW